MESDGLMPRRAWAPLPGWVSGRSMPSAGRKFASPILLHDISLFGPWQCFMPFSATAAVPQQDHLGDPRDGAGEIHRHLDVERGLFPVHRGLVVDEAGVEAEAKDAASGCLDAGRIVELVGGAVRDENGDMRRRPGI